MLSCLLCHNSSPYSWGRAPDQDILSLSNAVLIDMESVGQPSFTIPYNQLHFLIKNQFTTPQIAKIMGTLVQTIQMKIS